MARPSALLAAVLLAAPTSGFKIYQNLNLYDQEMMDKSSKWAEGRELTDGVMGMGVLKDFPTPDERKELWALFPDGERVLNTKWSTADSDGAGVWEASVRDKWGFDSTALFLWDSGKVGGGAMNGMPTPEMVDQVAGETDKQIYLLGRSWPEDDPQTLQKMKDSINHPQVAGVLIEAGPGGYIPRVEGQTLERTKILKYVRDSGKAMIMMLNASPQGFPTDRWGYIQGLKLMVQFLEDELGNGSLCKESEFDLTLMTSRVGMDDLGLKALPERKRRGRIANTLTGGVLKLAQLRDRYCSDQRGFTP